MQTNVIRYYARNREKKLAAVKAYQAPGAERSATRDRLVSGDEPAHFFAR